MGLGGRFWCSCGGLGLVLILGESSPYARMLFAFGLALLIVGLAIREHSSRLYWPGLFLLMGNASYSIYLVHNPLLSITQRLAARLGLAWGGGWCSA